MEKELVFPSESVMAVGGAIRRRFRYSKHACNQTRSVEANLLDYGVDLTDIRYAIGSTHCVRHAGAVNGMIPSMIFPRERV